MIVVHVAVCSVVLWHVDYVIDSMFGERTRESSGTQQREKMMMCSVMHLPKMLFRVPRAPRGATMQHAPCGCATQ